MYTEYEFQLQIIMVGVKESIVIVVCQAVCKDYGSYLMHRV
jgi:hypothetical protein